MIAKRTDNANLPSKLALRRAFLRRYHSGGVPTVFDACCAGGTVWGEIRKEFTVRYLAADRRPRRLAVRVDDSRRILTLPGAEFDVIDLDVYGEPWDLLQAACAGIRRPTTLFITVGFVRIFGFAVGVSDGIMSMLGLPHGTPRNIAGDLLEWAILRLIWAATRPHRIIYAAESSRSAHARYFGLRLLPPLAIPARRDERSDG